MVSSKAAPTEGQKSRASFKKVSWRLWSSDWLGDGAALAAPAPEVKGPQGSHGKVLPAAGWGMGGGGMKGGEASSPAARE